MNISVAMATYNGEKYIKEQLDSILCQIGDLDEIVISDDGSTDSTLAIVHEYMEKDSRIRLISGPKKGVFKNFENAFLHCNKEVIFLSDQDDIWAPDKVAHVLMKMNDPQVELVIHNATCFSGDETIANRLLKYRRGFLVNLVKSSYWGCCMAFRKSLIQEYLPFGIAGSAHDQLIGLLSEKKGASVYIDEALTYHRIHSANVSGKIPLKDKLIFRMRVLRDYLAVEKNRTEKKS